MNEVVRHQPAEPGPALLPALPAPPLPAAVTAHLRALDVHAEAVAAYADAARRVRAARSEAEREDAERERESAFVGRAPTLPALAEAQRRQVEAAREALAEAMAPVTLDVLRAWLAPINAAVRNPQGRAEFAARLAGLHDLLGDLPCGVFTVEARRRLAPDFFPSARDIRSALEPDAAALRKRLGLLDAMLAPKPAPKEEARPEPTEAEREAVQKQMAALAAELNGRGKDGERQRPAVTPSLLTPAQRIAACEQALWRDPGNTAARDALAALRRNYGGEGEHGEGT